MIWQRGVLALFFLMGLLSACSSDEVTGAVTKVTDEKDVLIQQLQSTIEDLNVKIEDLSEKNDRLNSSEELLQLRKMSQAQNAALDDYAVDLAECEERRDILETKNEELKQKAEILQRWVDTCQDRLGDLG